MATDRTTRALVLPHDSPPDLWRLKYLALLFDRVAIPHPDDHAVVNRLDWQETPPPEYLVKSVAPAEQMPFVRGSDFEDRYKALVANLEPIHHRGVIEILPLRPGSKEESTKLLEMVAHAVSNPQLVEAAVPDRSLNVPSYSFPNSFLTPMDISLDWVAPLKSIPRVKNLGSPKQIANAHENWSTVAWLRIGCLTKFLRKACLTDAVPAAMDDATAKLLLAVTTGPATPVTALQQQELAFSWGILNPLKLKDYLQDMSWHDVFRLRRELLPSFGMIRSEVQRRVQRLGPSQVQDIDQYRTAIANLRKEFDQLQEKELESMRSLLLKGLFTAGGTVATFAFVVSGGWTVVAGALAGGAISSNDIQSWWLSWRGKRGHVMYPIFALEQVAAAE